MSDREKLLEWINQYCNRKDLTDEGAISLILDKLETQAQQEGIASESLGDYSVSFIQGQTGESNIAFRMLKSYKRQRIV